MPITEKEVRDFLDNWYETVRTDRRAEAQAQHFLHPDSRIFAWDASALSLSDHVELHKQWVDEEHIIGPLDVAPVKDSPERVKVSGVVYWKGSYEDGTATAGAFSEIWMIERTDDGLKFVMYFVQHYCELPGFKALDPDVH